MNIKNLLTICYVLIALFLTACSTSEENSAPTITDTETFFTVEKNSSLILTADQFLASDPDADIITLVITGDENCTVTGQTITPVLDYVGDLFLQIAVTDGQLTSAAITIKVTVVDIATLYPVSEGAWWSYNDSEVGKAAATSKATIGTPIILNALSYFPLQWDGLVEENVQFLLTSDLAGVSVVGGICPTDTLIDPKQFVPHKAPLNYAWAYAPLEYVKTDKKFRFAAMTTITCTAVDVLVTVPAGAFNCTVFEYSHTVRSRGVSLFGTVTGDDFTRSIKTEKLYFAPNVGMVKAETFVDGSVVLTKELNNWSGNQ